jgi:hypothetical protein
MQTPKLFHYTKTKNHVRLKCFIEENDIYAFSGITQLLVFVLNKIMYGKH